MRRFHLSLLSHCLLNRLSHTIYWKSSISILGTSGYEINISLEKKDTLFAYRGDPDQTPRSVASDQGQHTVCQLPFYGSPDYNGLYQASGDSKLTSSAVDIAAAKLRSLSFAFTYRHCLLLNYHFLVINNGPHHTK